MRLTETEKRFCQEVVPLISRLEEAAAPFAAIGLARRFRQAVERSFRASTSVRDYAQMLGVTPSDLSESLRLETG